MNSDTALRIALDKAGRAKNKRKTRSKLGLPSVSKIISVFNDVCSIYGIRPVSLETKETMNMLAGFKRLLVRNEKDMQYVYDFFDKIIKNWDRLKLQSIVSDKGRPYTLHDVPSLRDIMICKTELLSRVENMGAIRISTERITKIKSGDKSKKSKKKKFAPSQADIDAEMERLYDE